MTAKTYLATLLFFLAGCNASKTTSGSKIPEVALDAMIAEMVMVGFRESAIDDKTPVYETLKKGYAKGVILFSRDWPSDFTRERNIKSKAQVTQLCSDLQKIGGKDLIYNQFLSKISNKKIEYEKPIFYPPLPCVYRKSTTRQLD